MRADFLKARAPGSAGPCRTAIGGDLVLELELQSGEPPRADLKDMLRAGRYRQTAIRHPCSIDPDCALFDLAVCLGGARSEARLLEQIRKLDPPGIPLDAL